jgi:hypothetical protein
MVMGMRRWGLLGLGIALAACMPYKPTLHLDNSPMTIPANVLMQPLRDLSPGEDREPATSQSFSQTGPDALEEELNVLVTRAIVAEFNTTGVFRSVAGSTRAPDLVLSGTIHRFHGQVTLPSWAMIPGLAWTVNMFWSPVQEREGLVDLELTLATPEGGIVGRYRGCDRYRETAGHDHHHWSMPLYPAHARLNQSFTEAVRQIRDQILEDREYISAAVTNPAAGPHRLTGDSDGSGACA